MNGQNQNPMGQNPIGTVMPQTPRVPEDKKSIGPIVGIVIIILVLVLGGLYFWGQKINMMDQGISPETVLNAEDASLVQLGQQSDSDTTASIEADLNATDISNLDTELDNIQSEAGAAQ